MPMSKYLRRDKQRPFYVTATIIIFAIFFLIGLWALRFSSEGQVAEKTARLPIDERFRSHEIESQVFEEGSGNEEKLEKPLMNASIDKKNKTLDLDLNKLENDAPGLDLNVQEKDAPVLDGNVGKKEAADPDFEQEVEGSEVSTKANEPVGMWPTPVNEKVAPDSDTELELEKSIVSIQTNETLGVWPTQANESKEERAEQKQETDSLGTNETPASPKQDDSEDANGKNNETHVHGETSLQTNVSSRKWELCAFEGAADYIPCLDNKKAIKALRSTKHYEHRERHCPDPTPTCLSPLPEGYSAPIRWPQSRNEIWFSNVPHPGLVSYKKGQNWVKKAGDRLIFPGGGTQFTHGALHYIDYIEQVLPDIAWGKHTRVILDVGCGVASFGGFLFDKDVLTMSFAPKDEHEAQIQLALERGIPALLSVMGTQRLAFPSNIYDAVHCARCRVPWHAEGGRLLFELNRVLRPGGYFLWSATPLYRNDQEDVGIWKEMMALTTAMCWDMVAKKYDRSVKVGIAIYRKPTTNFCYDGRNENSPPMCDDDDKPDAAWYIPISACIHRVPSQENVRGTEWPQDWPQRLTTPPSWLNNERGLYGKPATADFISDTDHWQRIVGNSYMHGLGIDWNNIRNVMDMKAVYGGFASALASQAVWVMNVVQFDEPDTLPIIFDRGLFGIYHDWCESFSSYPRTYDLFHSDHLFKKLKSRCTIETVVVEMDRLLRPEGWAIVRDKVDIIKELQPLFVSLHWDIQMTYLKGEEGLLAVQKRKWRPDAAS